MVGHSDSIDTVKGEIAFLRKFRVYDVIFYEQPQYCLLSPFLVLVYRLPHFEYEPEPYCLENLQWESYCSVKWNFLFTLAK